jgi:hypothetical protein
MGIYAALALTRQHQKDMEVRLAQRRLWHESRGTDPRFIERPGLGERIRAAYGRHLATRSLQRSETQRTPHFTV